LPKFDYFVVLAEMRTGSNFLESNLNRFDDLACVGEAFNPYFIGYPEMARLLGISQADRDADPQVMLDAVIHHTGLAGFRFFNDHDPRVLDQILTDPRCAKIVLTRNPVESFVSWKIASVTGQWKMTTATGQVTQKVRFDPTEFEHHLAALQAFQTRILNTLQRTGQTAFYIAYEDLQDVTIMNGLAHYLGSAAVIGSLDKKLKKQNPAGMADKVENFAEMEHALARMDRFNLARTPNFEPRRGAMIPHHIVAADSPLMFMPLKSGPTAAVEAWMADLDGCSADRLRRKFSQKSLRQWMRDTPGHRSFCVLRHPVAWAHSAFCTYIVSNAPGSFDEVRAGLRNSHGLDVPDNGPNPETDSTYDIVAHRTAFLQFLKFLRRNLSAQTGIRVDPAWGTQLGALAGMSDFCVPDLVAREDRLRQDLAIVAEQIGHDVMPDVPDVTDPHAALLSKIYDPQIEMAAREAYTRDYETFGFGNWA